jgi:hypothetical protein
VKPLATKDFVLALALLAAAALIGLVVSEMLP